MHILYVRISTLDQKTDRQRVSDKSFNYIVEDKCSGAISFFDRPGGKEILSLATAGPITSLSVWQIDRLGRDLRDILNTIHFFTQAKIPIHFISQNLQTLDVYGNENTIAKLMISVLGTVAEMQRNQIRENQLQGVRIAKARGVYKGRKKGSAEDTLAFLSKPKNKKALDLLKKGYKGVEVARILELNLNTITKIKKLGLQ